MKLYPVVMAGGSGNALLAALARAPSEAVSPAGLGQAAAGGDGGTAEGPGRADADLRGVRSGARGAGAPAAARASRRENVLVEPVARNTAPAIALATWVIGARDPDGVLAVLPSDHHVADPAGLSRRAQARREAGSRTGDLVTVGIKPTRPETGYGYIRLGAALGPGRASGSRPSSRSRTR